MITVTKTITAKAAQWLGPESIQDLRDVCGAIISVETDRDEPRIAIVNFDFTHAACHPVWRAPCPHIVRVGDWVVRNQAGAVWIDTDDALRASGWTVAE